MARRRVLLIADTPGWAFDRIARQLRRFLGRDFNVVITYNSTFHLRDDLLQRFAANFQPDVIHFMWRRSLFSHVREYIGGRPLTFVGELAETLSYSVYDHLDDTEYSSEIDFLDQKGTRVGFVNRELLLSYKGPSSNNRFRTRDGVDTDLFSLGVPRSKPHFVCGWVGNSRWLSPHDHKGLNSVLGPAFQLARKSYKDMSFEVIDSVRGAIPQNMVAIEMRQWDTVVIASVSEGTPNQLLEGLASGCTILATDVGMVREVLDFGAPVVLCERTPERFAEALLIEARRDEEERRHLRQLSRSVALQFDWREVVEDFRAMWS